MTYQVLARKWRPQTFDAVVGQEAITRTLRNAIVSGRIAHGYLFAGPRGCGKTTTARLLAKALMCQERQGPEPCDACAICREAQAGALTDIIEIDAASNRKIDDIRTLRDNVKYAPSRGRFKVYIVDEVHQLTPDAFDALLKTLEEPPPHVVFILATTDPRDVPLTVLSRVQRFDFRPIPPELMAASLARILDEEKLAYERDALPVVVRAAAGSLRDALSLLDTALAYGNGALSAATVAEVLGATSPAEVLAYCEGLLAYEATPCLEAIDRAAGRGDDLEAFTRDVIETLRRVLVLKASPDAHLEDLTAAEAAAYRKMGEGVGLDEVLYVLRAFLDAHEQIRQSPHPRVELEIATVRAARRPVPHTLEDLLRRIEDVQAQIGAGAFTGETTSLRQESLPGGPASSSAEPRRTVVSSTAAPPGRVTGDSAPTVERPAGRAPSAPETAPRPAPARPAAGIPPRETAVRQPPSPVASSPARPPAPRSAEEAPADRSAVPESAPAANGPAITDLATAWERIAGEVKARKALLGTLLGQARAVRFADGALFLAIEGAQFHRDQLTDRVNRDVILGAARKYLRGCERLELVDAPGAAASEGNDVRSHPAVQAALLELEGEVVAVRPRAPEGEAQ